MDLERFSPVAAVPDAAVPPAGAGAVSSGGPPPAVEALLDEVGGRAASVVMVNGQVVRLEVDPALAAQGVVVGLLADMPDGQELLAAVGDAPDALVELAAAFGRDPIVVRVPDGVEVDRPVVVCNWVDGIGSAVFPHTLIQVGDGSRVAVVEYVGSGPDESLVVPVTQMLVGEEATLTLVSVQDLGTQAWQTAHQTSRVGAKGQLLTFAAAFGGHYARVRTDSYLEGVGGTSKLMAAFFGGGDQMHDFRTMQAHDAPRTTSDLLFKGAVKDQAQSVYTGMIRVAKGASGTNAFQTNNNLVLSEGAHADSVPNLDIAENDVKCSHASTVGPIDNDQRYYLQSRGVPPEATDRLIVLGFFNDIFARLPVSELAGRMRSAVRAKLSPTDVVAGSGDGPTPGLAGSATAEGDS
ncbi:MAG: Fe-S cluster assembly protein SufD [Acidimicrobiales bacterium]